MDPFQGLDLSEATRQAIASKLPQTTEAAISLAIRHAGEDDLDRDVEQLGTGLEPHESAPETADWSRLGDVAVGEYADSTGNRRIELRTESDSEPIISAWRADLLSPDPDPVSLRLRGRSPFSPSAFSEAATGEWHDFLTGRLAEVGSLWRARAGTLAVEADPGMPRSPYVLSELADVMSNKLGIQGPAELQQRCRENGCTLSPDFDFVDCCNGHDLCYCHGCTEADRLACDEGLRTCIRAAGHPNLAEIYFRGVRWFGRGFFTYC